MDKGASASQTGPSQVEPVPVSPLRASVPSAEVFIRESLKAEIVLMLEELGEPPLVQRIFPNGWANGTKDDLINLYELCRRTYDARAKANG